MTDLNRQIDATAAHWFEKDNPPKRHGYYMCLNLDGSPSYRLWEENVWWKFSFIEPDEFGEDGGWELVPNNSISYWAYIESPAIVHVPVAGAA